MASGESFYEKPVGFPTEAQCVEEYEKAKVDQWVYWVSPCREVPKRVWEKVVMGATWYLSMPPGQHFGI